MVTAPARPIRVVALTPGGADLGRRLCASLTRARCWLPESRAAVGEPSFHELSEVFRDAFEGREDLVCIMAAGIVVRTVAPFLRGKDRDPAVVVVDEAGRFAVSLLSGHLGGANDLARRVAAILGGTPVITTATDVAGLPALDVWAAQSGLGIENLPALRPINMALLEGRSVRLVDPQGYFAHLTVNRAHLFISAADADAALATPGPPTVYIGDGERSWPTGWLILRPKSLVAGVGCHKDTPAAEILDFLRESFRRAGLSLLSLSAVATIAARKNEAGLREAARTLGVKFLWFTKEELGEVTVPHPSPHAARHLGVAGVAEAAALRAGGVELIVPKQKSANVTVAVARVAWRW